MEEEEDGRVEAVEAYQEQQLHRQQQETGLPSSSRAAVSALASLRSPLRRARPLVAPAPVEAPAAAAAAGTGPGSLSPSTLTARTLREEKTPTANHFSHADMLLQRHPPPLPTPASPDAPMRRSGSATAREHPSDDMISPRTVPSSYQPSQGAYSAAPLCTYHVSIACPADLLISYALRSSRRIGTVPAAAGVAVGPPILLAAPVTLTVSPLTRHGILHPNFSAPGQMATASRFTSKQLQCAHLEPEHARRHQQTQLLPPGRIHRH